MENLSQFLFNHALGKDFVNQQQEILRNCLNWDWWDFWDWRDWKK